MLTVDIDKGVALNICHTGTAEDLVHVTGSNRHLGIAIDNTLIAATVNITANSNLRLDCRSNQEHQKAYYGISQLHNSFII